MASPARKVGASAERGLHGEIRVKTWLWWKRYRREMARIAGASGVRAPKRPPRPKSLMENAEERRPDGYSPTTMSIGRSSSRARIAMRESGRSPMRSAWLAGTTSDSLAPSPARHLSFGMIPGIEAENR